MPTDTHEYVDREEAGPARLAWAACVSAVILLGIVSGGSSLASSAAFTAFRLLCVVLFLAALVRLLQTRISGIQWMAIALAGAGVLLVLLQLVPLPFEIFSQLPGRQYVVTAFTVAGIPIQPMPMTLSPEATRACLLALMPPLAIFFAGLTTKPRDQWIIAGAILLGAGANVLLGLAQRFEGPESDLYFYEFSNRGLATGFFSNRNNFAMLLCVSIPLIWALWDRLGNHLPDHRGLITAGCTVLMGMVFLGLAVSGSRSGILLGMLALVLSTVMMWPLASSGRRRSRSRWAILVLLGAALIIGQFGMIGLLRIAETDPVSEYRVQIAKITLEAAARYFPVGSGFGTFQQVYAIYERPDTTLSAYVNNAHNDWLQLWLEGGLPAAVLLAMFLALVLFQAARVWLPNGSYAQSPLPRAASIGVTVLLLHSLAEYPLRMPALASIFAFLLAAMLSPPRIRQNLLRHSTSRSREPEVVQNVMIKPVTPPVFTVRSADKFAKRLPKERTGA